MRLPSASPALGFGAWRWLVVFALAALALLAFERWFASRDQPNLALTDRPAGILVGLPANYNEALAGSDVHIATARERAAQRPDEWLAHDLLARAWLARARLTGSYQDYAAAAAALERSRAAAGPGTGPHLTGVMLSFAMHRLGEADAMVEEIAGYAVPPEPGERAELMAVRGDILFYRGAYAEALEAYDAADRIAPRTSDFRRAVYHSKTGRPDLAELWFDRADSSVRFSDAQSRARFELQRGILDLESGRWDEALAHFRRADEMFPGYWLIEEHIAEVTALKGDLGGAERLYRDIVRRTGHPEFMDALAGIAAQRGDRAAETRWLRRADAVWGERLRQFPEASYGHAIDHCVQKGDWGCALALARRNHDARPYGDAKIVLARALLHNGRPGEARVVIETVLASPWRTPALHAVAAEIYAAEGEADAASGQRHLALALDPHALD